MNTATLPLFDLAPRVPKHPAQYIAALLLPMAKILRGRKHILDPFGGLGGIFQLEHWLAESRIDAVEIEPEWASTHPKTTLGNALHLPWPDGYFDAICTSPTYSNRMRDTLIDAYDRITYTAKLGHKLHPDNSGAMGGKKYKAFHVKAWTEAKRVLTPDGIFVLNIKDFFEDGEIVHITGWHIGSLQSLGFRHVAHVQVDVPGMRYGENADLRVEYESVINFVLEDEA